MPPRDNGRRDGTKRRDRPGVGIRARGRPIRATRVPTLRRSGLQLPPISLGLWQNFGDDRPLATSRAILRRAFDLGITHFDLANNYGPPYGSAEINFGRIFAEDFTHLRDEIVISSKAGYDMWPGPYGDWGSRKYLLSSLDQSLKRMRLDHVDIFYSHRADPETPLRGDDGRAALGSPVGQGAVRRDLLLQPRAHRGGDRDPARPRHAAADPPAVVFDVQSLDRARSARRARVTRASAASPSRRWPRGC